MIRKVTTSYRKSTNIDSDYIKKSVWYLFNVIPIWKYVTEIKNEGVALLNMSFLHEPEDLDNEKGETVWVGVPFTDELEILDCEELAEIILSKVDLVNNGKLFAAGLDCKYKFPADNINLM